MSRFTVSVPLALLLPACAAAPLPSAPPQAGDAYYARGAEREAARGNGATSEHARNVILFIGDGMGVSTITAARIYGGEQAGMAGPEAYDLAMDQLPHAALVRTYSNNFQIADSAATATALTSGVKTNSGTIGVTAAATPGACAGAASATTENLFELAEAAGLATGVVSTARITHATPASVYGHTPARDWELDALVPEEAAAAGCVDLARQLVDWPAGDGLEIALGGGREMFLPDGMADPEDEDAMGARGDGRDLAAEWSAKSADHAVIWNQAQFDATDFASDARVLGLFEQSHMEYEHDRGADAGGEPSLAEMTRAAITRLQSDPDGFALLVEGGRIDHAHHAGNAARALGDTLAFDAAIAAALEMTSAEDTLVIVTADHSHTLTIAGYSARGAPILGLSVGADGAPALGTDGKPYTTLGYANGPGAVDGARADLSDVDTTDANFRQPALTPLYGETHGGEDVAAFAGGPGSEHVSGSMEQNELFFVMARSLGLVE